jgi:sugar phosphate isomerase/epimerase
MRFGIMAMQMDRLIPSGPPQEMMAALGRMRHAGLVDQIADAGFSLIELGGDLMLFFPHFYSPPEIDALARLKAERGLSFTLHLPLWSVEPSTPLRPVREGSVQAMAEVIRATQPLNIEYYVLHATGALAAEFSNMRLPEAGRALLMRQFQNNARESIKALLAQTGLPSRKLAVETIEFPFDLTLELAEALDLSICLDTGHVLAGFSGPVGLPEVLDRVLPRLGEIHLHDCPAWDPQRGKAYGLDHQPLGQGDLDTPYLLHRLEAAGWDGPIIFELSIPEALASLETIRAYGGPTGAQPA